MTNDHNRPPCNIVICSDGTGNAGGRTNGSNVWRIRQAVAESTQPGYGRMSRPQIVIYEDGVGTDAVTPLKVIGGAFGWGMTRDLKSLYGRLIREFQPGDQIYLFGFSRGAFTARTLANMLYVCGIADCWHDVEAKDGTVFRQRRTPEQIDAIVDKAIAVYKRRLSHRDKCDEFRMTFGRQWPEIPESPVCERGRFPIRFVGMWDTVDALGLPFDNTTQALANVGCPGFRLNLQRKDEEDWTTWEDDLHRNIQNAFHAIAVDDERQAFLPVLWLENVPVSINDRRMLQPKNGSEFDFGGRRKVEQVWFAGMHANVGGGYPKDQLAHVSLCWMMRHAAREGLAFDRQMWLEFEQQRDELGRLYDSRSGGGAFYRLQPRVIKQLSEQVGIGVPASPLDPDGTLTRKPMIHSSVFNRIRFSTRGYAPSGIPPEGDYEQVGDPPQRTIQNSPCNRRLSLREGEAAPSFSDTSWPVSDCTVAEETGKPCSKCTRELPVENDPWPRRKDIQDEVFDLVAVRRVLFYLLYLFVLGTVGTAFYVIRKPLRTSFVPAATTCVIWSFLCVLIMGFWKSMTHPIRNVDPDRDDNVEVTSVHRFGRQAFALFVVVLGLILFETTVSETLVTIAPQLLENEVKAITTRSGVFLGVTLCFLLLLTGNSAVRHCVRELNVFGWQVALGLRAKKPRPSLWLPLARRSRHPWMRKLGTFAERKLVPTIALGLIFLLALSVVFNEAVAIQVKSNVDYYKSPETTARNSDSPPVPGAAAKPPASSSTVAGQSWTREFDVRRILGTGIRLTRGRHYVVDLKPQSGTGPLGWQDATLPAGPEGIDRNKRTLVMKLAGFAKLNPKEKYFQLLATIGSPLEESFPIKGGIPFTAIESGELFLFVNDLPWFYGNNRGTALVTVTMIPRAKLTNDADSATSSREPTATPAKKPKSAQ